MLDILSGQEFETKRKKKKTTVIINIKVQNIFSKQHY